jgi:hypothetical protein
VTTRTTARIPAVAIALLAILIGVVPSFFNCQYDGKTLSLANGREVPMKCYWTARAALAVAVPLLAVGFLMAFSRRAETLRALGILGAVLGVMAILLPALLIGVCQHAGASCSLVMKPTLILAGILVIGVSLVSVAVSARRAEQTP